MSWLGEIAGADCLDLQVPQEPEKIIPWLAAQYKEEGACPRSLQGKRKENSLGFEKMTGKTH